MQKHTINLDNVNICTEILIRDDPPPAWRSSLKAQIPLSLQPAEKDQTVCLC